MTIVGKLLAILENMSMVGFTAARNTVSMIASSEENHTAATSVVLRSGIAELVKVMLVIDGSQRILESMMTLTDPLVPTAGSGPMRILRLDRRVTTVHLGIEPTTKPN